MSCWDCAGTVKVLLFTPVDVYLGQHHRVTARFSLFLEGSERTKRILGVLRAYGALPFCRLGLC